MCKKSHFSTIKRDFAIPALINLPFAYSFGANCHLSELPSDDNFPAVNDIDATL